MDIERAKALKAIVDDPNTPADVRFEASKEYLDMCDPDDVRRAVLPYLDEFLAAFQEDAQNPALDPETRRQAKEYAEYLQFRKRMLGDGTSTGNPP